MKLSLNLEKFILQSEDLLERRWRNGKLDCSITVKEELTIDLDLHGLLVNIKKQILAYSDLLPNIFTDN